MQTIKAADYEYKKQWHVTAIYYIIIKPKNIIYMEEYSMYEYDDEVLDTFLKKQTQLFSEEVADTPEAAEEFLEDCMAVVCKNIKEVRDYFDEAGSDISGMSDDELMDQSEVFAIADGRFLVVEG